MGTNITTHDGLELQHSRNMVVVKNANELTLINTVRLNEAGLVALNKLGKVTNVVRIGAFHGRDDAFYLDRFSAKLWALPGVKHEHHKITDFELGANQMPFPNSTLFVFETSIHPEAIIHLDQEGGILITCDSVKNWVNQDPFFSESTAKLYQTLGFFGKASISKIWQDATQVKENDFARLKKLSFNHLISAHGEPLLDEAYDRLMQSIYHEFAV